MPKGTPTKITADGVVGVSGKPVIIYGAAIGSGGTASVVALYNGTGTGGDLLCQMTGTISKKVLDPNIPEGGLYFPNGCYADVDTNIDGTNGHTFWIEQVRS